MRLVVLNLSRVEPERADDLEVLSWQELKRSAVSGRLLARLFRYAEVEMWTYSFHTLGRLFPTATVLRLLSHGPASFRDESGFTHRITWTYVWRLFLAFLRDWLSYRSLKRRLAERVADLPPRERTPALDLDRTPLYLRTDFAFGLTSGGSLGHIAGVFNNLDRFGGSPVFVTSDEITTVRDDLESHVVMPDARYRDLGEIWMASYNEHVISAAREAVAQRTVSFVYQRYSLENFAGLALSREWDVPYVCEYNGSEIWIARNWGRPLKHEDLAVQVEDANLEGADLVVVVSEAMRDELIGRGIDAESILVNYNGVDPDTYSPEVDGTAIRDRLGLAETLVVGFVGTFGHWHGAEVLADAFGRMVAADPELRHSVRLLMIGDGMTMPETREAVARHGIEDLVVFTGLVPQVDGAAHMAACDILASPHVPNPDGTPFFGSPTKLFEYMAMGKGIVASDLDQIGEVLDHDRTAWLVEPGAPDALAEGLRVLMDDPARRARLGEAARKDVVAKHTWVKHTERIVEALKERCGS